jgi:hypothetical protein
MVKQVWQSSDGKIHGSENEAEQHELKLSNVQLSLYNDYLNRYSGIALLEKHSLQEVGTWEVRGEDPNCDLGGSHHNPYLGTFHGRLQDVILKAVGMNGFWQWGGGGEIKLLEIEEVNE